jgi:hypothetical protein
MANIYQHPMYVWVSCMFYAALSGFLSRHVIFCLLNNNTAFLFCSIAKNPDIAL